MTEDVVILEPGDERAQKIGKAIASPTAGDILQLLAKGPLSSAEITTSLDIPMSTAKYHIENLLTAGLLEVSETRYSVKGREVKVYHLKDQLLIVAPKLVDIRSLMLKYASLFGITIVGTFIIAALTSLSSRQAAGVSRSMDGSTGGGGIAATSTPVSTMPVTAVPTTIPDITQVAEKYGGTVTTAAPASTMPVTAIPTPVHDITPLAQKTGELVTSPNFATLPPHDVPMTVVPGVAQGVPAPLFSPDPALIFFLGGCLVIAVLLIYEVYQWRKGK